MQFDVASRSGAICAIITVANILYFIGTSFVHEPTDLSSALFIGALVDVILGVTACVKRAWSVGIVLFSFTLLFLRMSIDFAT